jgi:hypothetical protein
MSHRISLIGPRSRRGISAAMVGTVAVLGLVACSEKTDSATATPTLSSAASGSAYDLKEVCPSTVVVQTDWNPETEHGGTYQLVGPDAKIDTDKKVVTGTLVAHGDIDTGVKIEVRAGGPAIGFQSVSALLYQDKSITLGYGATDEAVALSLTQPTVAVYAGLERSPQIIMWDPAKHPDWKTIADIGKTDTKVLYFQGAAYMDYLVGAKILKASQVDGSYDGNPTHFVGSGGEFAQQAFATSEPYTYEHEVRNWNKPVRYQLIADTGFDFYQSTLSVRKDALASLSPCLKKLVPIMQQATLDFVANPKPANDLILKLVEQYNNGWIYSAGVADYAVTTMKKLGIIGNGPDSTLGNYDMTRLQKVIDITKPIYTSQNKQVKQDLKPSDIATNDFIDPSIGLK